MKLVGIKKNSNLTDIKEYGRFIKKLKTEKCLEQIALKPLDNGRFDLTHYKNTITSSDSSTFENANVNFYEYESTNGLRALIISGAVEALMIPVYNIETLGKAPELEEDFTKVEMLQYELSQDRVTAMRNIVIPNSIAKRILGVFYNNSFIASYAKQEELRILTDKVAEEVELYPEKMIYLGHEHDSALIDVLLYPEY